MNAWQGWGRDFRNLSKYILSVGALSILGTVVCVGWLTQPNRFSRYYQPQQPVFYSHKLHAGTMRIPCLYCHGGAAKSRHAGIPPVEKCMNCHRVTKTDSPEIKKVSAAWESGKPMAWARIHALPDHAYFDHRPHVHAQILCQTCHGEVQTMDVLYQTMSMRMSHCLGCHRDPGKALPPESQNIKAPENCNACHR